MSEYLKKISEKEITDKVTEATVKFAEEYGKFLTSHDESGKPLTTNQLRKFFGEVKRQQMVGFNKTDIVLLKPKLAYAVGRDKENTKIKDFYEVMSKLIDLVDNEEQFKNFIKVFEAIVAYHKKYEK